MIPVRPIIGIVEAALCAVVLAASAYTLLRLCRRHPGEAGVALLLAVLGGYALVALDAARHGAGP